jgi:hypothetical protein
LTVWLSAQSLSEFGILGEGLDLRREEIALLADLAGADAIHRGSTGVLFDAVRIRLVAEELLACAHGTRPRIVRGADGDLSGRCGRCD